MKYIIILLIAIPYSIPLFSQCWNPPQPNTITTNWNVSTQDYSTIPYNVNTWNWMQMSYNNIYFKSAILTANGWTNPQTIPAPWYPPGSLDDNTYDFWNNWNIYHTMDSVDCHPEDGWELLYLNFGYATDPCGTGNTGDAIEVENPFFALYNRYLGKIRVFMYIMDPSVTGTGAAIMASISSARVPALLAPASAIMQPVDAMQKSLTQTVPNQYLNLATEFWLYADIPIAYDPCTCGYPSTLNFQFDVLSDESVSLTADGTSTVTQMVTGGGGSSGVPTAGTGLQGVLSSTTAALSAGQKEYSSFNTFKTDITGSGGVKSKQQSFLQTLIDSASFAAISQVATYIPYVGMAVGLLDYFVQGAQKTTKPSVTTFEGNYHYNITGSIIGSYNGDIKGGNTPGSTPFATCKGPIYNNILGVINLIHPPTLNFVDYAANPVFVSNGDYNTTVRQYKVATGPVFALNPAANLKIVSFEACIDLQYANATPTSNTVWDMKSNTFVTNKPQPVEFGIIDTLLLNYSQRMENIGMEVAQYTTSATNRFIDIRTRFMPLQCFTNTEFMLYHDPSTTSLLPLFCCKIKVVLQRTDGDPHLVMYSATYPIQSSSITVDPNLSEYVDSYGPLQYIFSTVDDDSDEVVNNLAYTITPYPFYVVTSPYYSTSAEMIREDITLDNQNVTSNLSAWNTITIGNDVTFASGVTLTAGNGINISRTNTYSPNVTFKIANPVGCSGSFNDYAATDAELTSFCNSARYADTLSVASPEIVKHQNQPDPDVFAVFPNPATPEDKINVRYSILETSPVEVYVTDIQGNVVMNLVNESQQQPGTYNVSSGTGNLAPGVYFVNYQTKNTRQTKKIVVENQ